MISLILAINVETLEKALQIFWQGLLAIFIVIGIIILVTYLLKFIFVRPKKETKDANTDQSSQEGHS